MSTEKCEEVRGVKMFLSHYSHIPIRLDEYRYHIKPNPTPTTNNKLNTPILPTPVQYPYILTSIYPYIIFVRTYLTSYVYVYPYIRQVLRLLFPGREPHDPQVCARYIYIKEAIPLTCWGTSGQQVVCCKALALLYHPPYSQYHTITITLTLTTSFYDMFDIHACTHDPLQSERAPPSQGQAGFHV